MYPIGKPPKRSLFKEKVVVCKENFADVRTDVVINFCVPTVLSGPPLFDQLHKMAGPNLMAECEQFRGMAPTSCRVTNAFEAVNFRLIVHTLVPVPLNLQRPIDLRKVYLCVRNALDTAAEEGATTIAFPSYFPGIEVKLGCELILRIFTDWIHRSFYSDQIAEIKVVCPTEAEYHDFVDAAKGLYSEAKLMNSNFIPPFMRPSTVVIPSKYLHHPLPRARRSRRTYDPPLEPAPIKLELSAKLAPTILVIDDEHGLKRQYRLTNRSRDGRKLYFRCSRCDTLIKKDGRRIRAKLIVQDGHIVSERYPEHHPDCEAKTHEDIFMQQIDRSSRRDVKDGNLMPQEAYRKAINRVLQESEEGSGVDGAVERFPEWPRLRQQYCRIRKTAMTKRYKEEDIRQRQQLHEFEHIYGRSFMAKKGKYSPTFDHIGGDVFVDDEQMDMMENGDGIVDLVEYDVMVGDEMGGHHGHHLHDPHHRRMMMDEEYALLTEGSVDGDEIKHHVEVKNDGGPITQEGEEDDAIINVDDDIIGGGDSVMKHQRRHHHHGLTTRRSHYPPAEVEEQRHSVDPDDHEFVP